MITPSRFERYEMKYRLTEAQYARLYPALRPRLQADAYGPSTIASLYYDTPDRRLIRRSLEHPVYKEKLRLRSYGAAQKDDPVFLELKKKYDHVTYKRRVGMTLGQALDYLATGRAAVPETQILREIRYFREFYSPLEPAMLLLYDREAFTCCEDDSLRITFDHHVRFRKRDVSLTDVQTGTPLLPGESLLEIKSGRALPLWLIRLLREHAVTRTSFSKYGAAYRYRDTEGQSAALAYC